MSSPISIYQRALGDDFFKLHPRIRQRFGLSSIHGRAAIGRGVMEIVDHGPWYTIPFLHLGKLRHMLFPEDGRDVPFTVENYAWVDRYGREMVSWVRTFTLPKRQRRFDAYMIYSERHQRVVDYLGTHTHLAVDIDMSVSEVGGLRLRSGSQRFFEGPIGFTYPMFFSGVADVHEWWDEASDCYRIEVNVSNRWWGKLFRYVGRFDVEWIAAREIPAHVQPKRTTKRE